MSTGSPFVKVNQLLCLSTPVGREVSRRPVSDVDSDKRLKRELGSTAID